MGLKKCCCCVDLLQGVKILGIVLLTMTCLSILGSIITAFTTEVEAYYGIAGALPSLIINLLLIIACNKRNRFLLLPWYIPAKPPVTLS